MANGPSPKVNPSFEELRRTQDPVIRESIIVSCLPVVRSVVRFYLGKGFSRETLFSVGCIGLIQAVDRFDPTRGVPFEAYAREVIAGEIKHHFRDFSWKVSVPRSLKEDILRVNRAVPVLTQEFRRSPTIQEIAQKAGLTEERVLEALELSRESEVPFDTVEGEDPMTVHGTLQSTGGPFLSERIASRLDLKKVLEALPGRERLVVTLYHSHGMTQGEIASRLKTSQVQISRLLEQAIAKLKEQLGP